MYRRLLLILIAAMLLAPRLSGQDNQPENTVPVFETDVAPLLKKHCWKCHNQRTRKGELNLQTLAGLHAGGESGEAVIEAGKPDASPLMALVDQGKMPPGDRKLSRDERDLLRRWISAGARGAAHPGQLLTEPQRLARRVRFLMQIKCQSCHGRAKQEGGLDLRTLAAALKGGKSGPALVPGNAASSLIVKRILADQMPPRDVRYKLSIKPVTETELAMIRQWIDRGAEVPPPPPGTIADDGLLVTEDDRQWWSFQSPQRSEVPRPVGTAGHNPIDAFLRHKLRSQELDYAPRASRQTLIRRVTIDLTGLSPSEQETRAFVEDSAPDAYHRLVDRLLTSPGYGERWAQHWLDAAGYADSEGSASADQIWPLAYRYRDYVVRSLNSDKPYNRFLLEQLAGDQLADYTRVDRMSPELRDNLIATGYLRTCIDPTTSPETNFLVDRYQVLADTVEIVSSSLMGLTMRCARCHSHKYDPIPLRDYYRFTAIFASAYSPYEWVKPLDRYVVLAGKQDLDDIARFNAGIKQQIEQVERDLSALTNTQAEMLLRTKLSEIPKAERAVIEHILAIMPMKRSKEQQKRITDAWKQLLGGKDNLLNQNPSYKQAKDRLVKRKATLNKQIQTAVRAHGLSDMRQEPDPFFLLRRGEWHNRGRQVLPNVPAVLKRKPGEFLVRQPHHDGVASGTRLALAKWLTQADHPLTARVLVNRSWQHFFGRGIVSSAGDFGHSGALPSHPKLLDWLAVQFVQQGWSMKQLHRLIVTCQAYQQGSRSRESANQRDPSNRLLWRMPIRRMDAETLRDCVLAVTGQLDRRMYGEPAGVKTRKDGQIVSGTDGPGEPRTIYLLHRRSTPLTLLETFDAPRMNTNCIQRRTSTVVSQALLMLNSEFSEQQAVILAERIAAAHPTEVAGQLRSAYKAVLGRSPTQLELQLGITFLDSQRQRYGSRPKASSVPEIQRVIGMHANKGITFDLDAFRKSQQGKQTKLTRFQAVAGLGFYPQGNGDAHWYVVVDGEKRAEGHLRNNTFAEIDLDVHDSDRFLTLITSSNGTMDTDWTFFGNPKLITAAAGDENFLDLADVVGGGNGRGTGRTVGINPWTGAVVHTQTGGTNGVANEVHPVMNHPLIDCVFVPHGRADGRQRIPITTSGLKVSGISAGAGNSTYGHIWNGHNQEVNGLKQPSLVARDPALVDLCLVLFNSAEFLYID